MQGQCAIPDDLAGHRVIQISAGYFHSLALLDDNTVRAWGDDDSDQCAIPDFAGLKVVQVSAGASHSMALMEDNTVRAWGIEDDGVCIIPDFGGLRVLQIAAGGNHSMALLEAELKNSLPRRPQKSLTFFSSR
eukprot:Hpha_TRINITY_DN8308_c0_g1::TRINITY_DN8308_c0_g1_i1::g.154265::m.154265